MATKKEAVVRFSDLHDKMVQVTTGLITKAGFKEWLKNVIIVKEYLPLVSKYTYIDILASIFQNKFFNQGDLKNVSTDYIFMEYDIAVTFELLFAYTNIDFLPNDRTTNNYDLIKRSGLYEYIVAKCKNDYLELVEKCDRATGINNVNVMNQIANILQTNIKVEDVERMRDILNNEVDANKIQLIKDVEAYNNPTLTRVFNEIVASSTKEVMKKDEPNG